MADDELWLPASRSLDRLIEQRAESLSREWMGEFQRLEESTYDRTFDFEFSQPFAGSLQDGLQAFPPADQIREWTVAERRAILTRAFFLWERNPLAKGAIRVIRSFVVSTGLNVTYRNPQVQEIIENFRVQNRKRIQRGERQWFEQLIRDGEVFVRIVSNNLKGELNKASVVTIKPWLVEHIESEEGDRDDIINYYIRPEIGTGSPNDPQRDSGIAEPIPEDEIIHCYINAVGYDMRGRSELFVIMPWLRAYSDWLANRARINRYKGFLYHLQLRDATAGQVTTKRSAFRQPPAPGSVYVSSDKETLNAMDTSTGADRAAEDGRQIKLMNLIGLGMPEYMVSEGENANLATARSQQLPALRTFLDYQDIYTQELWHPIYEMVLKMAGLECDAMIDEYDSKGTKTGKQIRVYEAFSVEAQQLVDDDPKNLAEALTLHAQNGWASKKTLSGRAGYDFDAEQEMISAEEQEDAQAIMQGRKLGIVDPLAVGARTNGHNPDDDAEEDDF
jgi:hypothetical protein